MMATTFEDLGPFAPARGAPSPPAIVAAAATAGSAALAIARPALDAIGASDTRWLTRVAVSLAFIGAAAALSALFLAASRGAGGDRLARVSLGVAAVAGIGAFLYGAVEDGSLDLGEFGVQYFNGEILTDIRGDLLRGAINTVKLAFVSEAFAIAVGLVTATLVLSKRPWLHYPAVAYVDLVRGLPLVMLTVLINDGLTYVGITLSFFSAVVATLTINASAYIAEIFRAGIQALPRGQVDAARSLGMSQASAMLFVVIPQAVRSVIPPLMNEFVALVKDTAIVVALVGFTVATRELYGAARQGASSTFSPTPLMAASIVYLLITVPLSRLVGVVERRLRRGIA